MIAYGDRAKFVYDWMLKRILSTELSPGTFIDKARIAEEIGVSKQPVTVALSRLAREGWVEIESRVGSYVARVEPAKIREFAFVWFAAQSLLVREAATSSDGEIKSALTECLRLCANKIREGRADEAIAMVHTARMTNLRNPRNTRARGYFEVFSAHFQRHLAEVATTSAQADRIEAFQKRILELDLEVIANIVRGDPAGAQRAADQSKKHFNDFLDESERLAKEA